MAGAIELAVWAVWQEESLQSLCRKMCAFDQVDPDESVCRVIGPVSQLQTRFYTVESATEPRWKTYETAARAALWFIQEEAEKALAKAKEVA